MFKQRKPGKAASRTRAIDVDSMDLEAGDSTVQTPGSGTPTVSDESPTVLSPAAIKAKMKATRKKPETRLSFNADPEEGEDGDNGGDVFKLKKSMLSRKLMQKTSPSTPNVGTTTPGQSNSPKYDDEYLRQLKASTPQSRSSLSTYQESATAETGVSVDPEAVARLNITAMDDDAVNTVIPAESTIKLAKERRVRAQANKGSEDDFISLSLTRREETDDGPHPESRLVREEDELGEAEDEFAEYTSAQERVAIGKKSRKAEASKKRASMKEMIEDADEQDEETMEWEQEQLRRGGHRAASAQPAVKQEYRPAPIPDPTPLPTLTASVNRLNQSISTLTASHASKASSMATLAVEMQGHEKRETELREMVGRAEDKRAFFVAFREWVESVAAFLDEKFPHLEKLEEQHLSILKEKADMVAKRRRDDDEDDINTFLPSVPKDSTAAPEEEAQEEELDEYGRVIPQPTSASRRADRLARRTQRHSTRRAAAQRQEAEEGYSTDSSLSPPTATAYKSALARLSSSTSALLSDVRAPEFRDPEKTGGLVTWWGRWRLDWEECYVGAWGGLGLVGAWEFWAREEVCGWDCVEDPRSLDSFRWYQGLYAYSRPRDLGSTGAPGVDELNGSHQDDEAPLGPDGDLVGAMISTAVVPRLCAVLEGGAFDVYSSAHVRRVVDLVEEVEASLQDAGANAKFQILLKSVFSTFAQAIRDAEGRLLARVKAAAAGHALSFNPDSIPARRRVMARLVKLLVNLLKWRKYNGDRCGLGGLVIRLIELLELVAETGWDVGGQDLMIQVVDKLPAELVPQGLRARLQ